MEISELIQWIKEVNTKLDNHLHDVSSSIAKIQTDVEWIKRTYWTLVAAFITAIIGAIVTIIINLI